MKYPEYIADPLRWIEKVYGDAIKLKSGVQTRTGLSTQQEQAFNELGKLIRAKIAAYKVGRKEWKYKLTEEEKQYASKMGISIQSGKGTGKDFFAALVDRYFQTVFPQAKNLCTANNDNQLKNVLWSEIAKVMDMSLPVDQTKPVSEANPPVLRYMFQWGTEKIYCKNGKGERWFTEAATWSRSGTEKEQSATLGGRHEDFMCIIFDEASTIPDAVFRGIEGTLTGICNIVVCIFNPTRNVGFAIESQGIDRARWLCLHWNSEDSELVSKQHIASMKEKYDRDDAPYRIDVLGLPPMDDSNTLISYQDIMDAIDRQIEPLPDSPIIKSVDCGAGGDKSIINTRRGGKIYKMKKSHTKDSNELTDWIIGDFFNDEAHAVIIDVIGIGWAIAGNVRQRLGGRCKTFDSREKARRDDRFFNRRAEAYYKMAEAFQNKSISIPNDKELIDQLAVIKVDKNDLQGRIKIVKKDVIKKEIGHSPDEVDALAMSFMVDDNAFQKKEERDPYSFKKSYQPQHEKMWMAV